MTSESQNKLLARRFLEEVSEPSAVCPPLGKRLPCGRLMFSEFATAELLSIGEAATPWRHCWKSECCGGQPSSELRTHTLKAYEGNRRPMAHFWQEPMISAAKNEELAERICSLTLRRALGNSSRRFYGNSSANKGIAVGGSVQADRTFWLRASLLVMFCGLALSTRAQFTLATNSGSITITRYTGDGVDVSIPNKTNGLPVIGLASYAFYYAHVTRVSIPDSVTAIADGAFYQCARLTNITVDPLNPAFSSVGGVLFDREQTVLLRFPSGKSGDYMVPSGVTAVGSFAFEYSRCLTNVVIPEGVTNIQLAAFQSCTNLVGVALPASLTELGDHVFAGCSSLSAIMLPAGITAIPDSCFYGCVSLSNVSIPGSVRRIGSSAFCSCSSLSYIAVPNAVTNIGSRVFQSCISLKSVTLPAALAEIGDWAFSSCTSLSTLTLPASMVVIGQGVFDSCMNLTNANLPSGLTSLGTYAFSGCASLPATVIPGSVTNIGDWAFHSCTSLGRITILDAPASIGFSAFYNCPSLTNVWLGKRVSMIGGLAFGYAAALSSIAVPDSVQKIDSGAFDGCTALTSITIGSGVTNLGYQSFQNCSNLQTLWFRGKAPSVDVEAFLNVNRLVAYYLPGTTGWGPSLGGRPAILWNPKPQTSASTFGVRSGRFGFSINGTANIPFVIEASGNLSSPDWQPIQSCTLTNGSLYFSDPAWRNYPERLYRIRSP